MTIAEFIRQVLAIKDPDDALAFFERIVTQLRQEHPEVQDPEMVVRSNIGWCFGEGMSIPCRKMWTALCGAEHPVFGKMERNPTPDEAFQAGIRAATKGWKQHHQTAWDHLLRED
jgi:hypothetical protein